jgi:hypothetical protein
MQLQQAIALAARTGKSNRSTRCWLQKARATRQHAKLEHSQLSQHAAFDAAATSNIRINRSSTSTKHLRCVVARSKIDWFVVGNLVLLVSNCHAISSDERTGLVRGRHARPCSWPCFGGRRRGSMGGVRGF